MECTSVAKNPLQEHGRMEKISTKVLTFVNLCLWPAHHFSSGDLLETTFSLSREFKLCILFFTETTLKRTSCPVIVSLAHDRGDLASTTRRYFCRSYTVLCSITQLCLTLCKPMDYSLQRFSIHGIFQARVLEWVAISFSTLPTRYMQIKTTVSYHSLPFK